MNLIKAYSGILISHHHLDELLQVMWFYVSIGWQTFIVIAKIYLFLYVRDLRIIRYVSFKNSGFTERGNSGVNGGFVVPITRLKRSSLVSNTIGKGARYYTTKAEKSEGLSKLVELAEKNKNELKNNKIFNIISDIDILISAYNNIKSNMTGIDKNYFHNLQKDLISGKFNFSPVKIPKPFSIDSLIVQEAINMVLDVIFDNKINSHGFRKNKNCLTAIWQVRNMEVNWFIKVDLKKCFDTISHDLVIQRLREYIRDEQFIDLIYKFLRAGYIDPNGTYFKTKIGIPQGSIISPILSNIVLGLIDEWLDNYIKKYNKELQRKIRTENINISSRIRRIPNYKCMKYVRYVDDILIGVIGSYKDCLIIKKALEDYINHIGLGMNREKTLITNSVNFLGYEINISPGIITTRLNAPIKKLVLKLEAAGFCKNGIVGNPTRCGRLIHEDLHTIVNYYKNILLGVLNYYVIASNFTTLKWRMYYILFYSCILTFAAKLKLKNKRKVLKKFGTKLEVKRVTNGIETIVTDFDKVKIFKDLTSDHFVNFDDKFIDKLIYKLPRSKTNYIRDDYLKSKMNRKRL